jgi:hypothetical protein
MWLSSARPDQLIRKAIQIKGISSANCANFHELNLQEKHSRPLAQFADYHVRGLCVEISFARFAPFGGHEFLSASSASSAVEKRNSAGGWPCAVREIPATRVSHASRNPRS